MSETIKLSPEMLISQAAQLSTLSNDFNNLFDSVVSELNTINGCLLYTSDAADD